MNRTHLLSFAALLFATAPGCEKASMYDLPSTDETRELRERSAAPRSAPERAEGRTKIIRLPTAGDAAADALARIGGPALPALIEALGSDIPATRARAARAIGLMEGSEPRAIEALSKALRDPNADVREHAARALGHIGPPAKAAIPDLIELLAE